MIPARIVCAACCTVLSCTLTLSQAAAVVVTYSEVKINSLSSVLDAGPDSASSITGGGAQVSAAGSRTAAFNNGLGQFQIKSITDSVFASAMLATGELKALSSLTFGANMNSVAMPVGVRNGAAFATAAFADSFRTFSGASPFLWTAGESAVFTFGINGSVGQTAGVQTAASHPGTLNEIYSSLAFTALTPGTLDLLYELQHFDFARGFDAFLALNAQVEAGVLARKFWCLGPGTGITCSGGAEIVAVDASSVTAVEFSFEPGGDFDWFLQLDTQAFLDASQENVFATRDFAHTIQTGYSGPSGTTTFSASGLFPGTASVTAVAEPGSMALVGAALGAFGLSRRRRKPCASRP